MTERPGRRGQGEQELGKGYGGRISSQGKYFVFQGAGQLSTPKTLIFESIERDFIQHISSSNFAI